MNYYNEVHNLPFIFLNYVLKMMDKFNDNTFFRAKRLGLFYEATLIEATFSGVRMIIYCISFFLFLTYGTES